MSTEDQWSIFGHFPLLRKEVDLKRFHTFQLYLQVCTTLQFTIRAVVVWRELIARRTNFQLSRLDLRRQHGRLVDRFGLGVDLQTRTRIEIATHDSYRLLALLQEYNANRRLVSQWWSHSQVNHDVNIVYLKMMADRTPRLKFRTGNEDAAFWQP